MKITLKKTDIKNRYRAVNEKDYIMDCFVEKDKYGVWFVCDKGWGQSYSADELIAIAQVMKKLKK